MCATAASSAVDHADRQHRGQELPAPVLLGRGRHAGRQAARRLVAAQLASGLGQGGGDRRQQPLRPRGVDQQGLGRAAHRCPPQLGVQHHLAGHVEVGGAVDEGVADPLEVAEHGRPRLALHPLDQALAAARDDQVDGAVQPAQDQAHRLAVLGGDQLHGGLGQAGAGEALGDRRVDRLAITGFPINCAGAQA